MSYSAKATRDAFGQILEKLGHENPRIVVMDADLSCSTKSAIFAKSFPGRFFQLGIAESNMVGTAAGMALTGYTPFICSFGAFLTGRHETIRMSVGYSQTNVKIVGTHAGVGIGEDGHSQMGLEDVNVMRSIPGMTIFQPCDEATTHAAVRYAAATEGPFYLRLTRQKLPALHNSESVFKCGKGIVLKEGKQLALIGSGATVSELMKASEQLQDLQPWVIDMHTILPIDRDLVQHLSKVCNHIITVEDHNVIGGLGTAVAEVMAETSQDKAKLTRFGIEGFGESGDPGELYVKFGLAAEKLVGRIRRAVG